jgi:hypothetical protein
LSTRTSKRSTPFNLGSVEDPEEPLDEVEYIRLAADLLQKLFSELQALTARNPGLARALSSRGADARAGLLTLHETVDLLMGVDDISMAVPLRRRATSLISWLSNEVDELTLRATTYDHRVDAFRVALH